MARGVCLTFQRQKSATPASEETPAHNNREQDGRLVIKDPDSGITFRFPSERPTLTPRAARALLGILREVTDQEYRKRMNAVDAENPAADHGA
jgi:hypothetical protein